ncbi:MULTISPECIES: aspartate/glutamate racemase family protein [Flavobacteriaceae]|uniref:aspartate/glutamate racemase family protein n=1 Tax=Flavobacteriaceae TaxID=49546 RepID=UPI00234A7A59|nr:amino acid racemase [Muricauda sp. SP22]MDC6363623.1 amino acid racemase [Muricauda sp. SP22]
MKTIGLIGGMGWESSKLYYEFINKRTNTVLGGSHSAKMVMVSVDFSEIEKLTFANQWDAIGILMKKATKQLENAGADLILLGTNTIHMVEHYITENTHIPFLHIADATAQAIQDRNLGKVALLGTKFTMEKDFYTRILNDHYQIETIIPSKSDRQLVHDIIYNELVKGIFTEASKQLIINIINELILKGAEGVILGCTELPTLIPETDVTIPTFDTGRIHAYKAVEIATKSKTN